VIGRQMADDEAVEWVAAMWAEAVTKGEKPKQR
jgi:hypothetical protein